MLPRFSKSARLALDQAENAARCLNHHYVGTEHLLLGLLETDSGALAAALHTCGVDSRQVRTQILRMVQPGPQPAAGRKLPFTPRVNQALAFAAQEAWGVHQEQLGPEHLLLGLAREPNGIASQVLSSLGLSFEVARCRLLAHRIEQLKFVERIVRAVPSSITHKRKMREELLTHLTAIYGEELVRHNDPAAAWRSATERFGEPAAIALELRNSLPRRERLKDFLERRLGIGWRPPETAWRWMTRWALQLAALLAALNVLAAVWVLAAFGANPGAWPVIRAIALMSLCIPLLQFTLGIAFFKMRDALFGVFGTRKSNLTVAAMATLMSLAIAATFATFVLLTVGHLTDPAQLAAIALASIGTPLVAYYVIRVDGPQELRDTLWACLDLDNRPPDDQPTLHPAP